MPTTELVGDQIRYVKDGSNSILRCVVRGALEPPIYISWFYGAKQIFDGNPRGWRVTLERDVLDNEHDGSHSSVSAGERHIIMWMMMTVMMMRGRVRRNSSGRTHGVISILAIYISSS